MGWVPTASVESVRDAAPADTAAALPSATPLSLNWTVPADGVPGAPAHAVGEQATVAVRVTDAPVVLGFRLDVTVVVVAQLELHAATRMASCGWWLPPRW